MKTVRLLLIAIVCMSMAMNAEAQFLENLTKHAKEKVKQKAKQKLVQKVDEQLDPDAKRVKSTVENKKPANKPRPSGNNRVKSSQPKPNMASGAGNLVWNRYDFVPGDVVIFEDGPSITEENGEFPSRWDLVNGQVEIVEVDGETCVGFLNKGWIVPNLKNPSKDYLPDVFTLEFDFYSPDTYGVYFYLKDCKHQGSGQEFYVEPHYVDPPDYSNSYHPDRKNACKECWTHISLAYNKGKLKFYIDDARVLNIPNYKYNPTGFEIGTNRARGTNRFYVKNVRIAQGGMRYADRLQQDGKIVTSGIRFERGKTTLKPESMGPINKIYKLMKKNPEFKFVVEGHTDADGNGTTNQTLSEGRAKVVMQRLIQMGISKDRLQSKGWGATKPIAGNDTPEGKANNRRVEFVKF